MRGFFIGMNTLHLCATNRLAQQVRESIPSDAPTAWLAPVAMTVSQWLASLSEELMLTGIALLPAPLSPFAEQLLWEQVIDQSLAEDEAAIFDLSGMARNAREAHGLIRHWGQNGEALSPDRLKDNLESTYFLRWQTVFLQRCAALEVLDLAGVQWQVVRWLEKGVLSLPSEVRVLGFDRPGPLEMALFAALTARGVTVSFELSEENAPVSRVVVCSDLKAECEAVVAWVQSQQSTADPLRPLRLGIVAPDMSAVRAPLSALLEDVLQPVLLRPDMQDQPRPWNLSLGDPLADMPLVFVGLQWLQQGVAPRKQALADLGALWLQSGWSAVEELDARAQGEGLLRQRLPFFTTWRAVHSVLSREGVACPQSLSALGDFLRHQDSLDHRKRLPSAWRDSFLACLKAIQWPGSRPLSSPEYQAQTAFLEEIQALAHLDALCGPVTAAEAVLRLQQACLQRVFQPETRGQPTIQVLGLLESAGLAFDALWVMGMQDDVWPAPARPNPLLPAEWQRQVGAAHASAEVELDFARRVHQRLLQAAPVVTFSWATREGNRHLRRSPLLAGWPDTILPPQSLSTVASTRAAQGPMALLADDQAPPLQPGEKVSGGSWVLRAQAICPAWAFYQYRLGAEALAVPVEGLDPAARGTLVHAALERVWQVLRTQARLLALSRAERAEVIEEAIAAAMTSFEAARKLTLPERFRRLEAACLARLIARWLDEEAHRPVPFTVQACEEAVELDVGVIRVRMVVDRIDLLESGERVILDYKTGRSIDVKNWAQDRLTEPQLPIYAALVSETPVAGVAFAKVLVDEPAFRGVAATGGLIPGVAGLGDSRQKTFPSERFADWSAVLSHWEARLLAIADEVQQGVAGVQVFDDKKLQYCDVLPLLRLPEYERWRQMQGEG